MGRKLQPGPIQTGGLSEVGVHGGRDRRLSRHFALQMFRFEIGVLHYVAGAMLVYSQAKLGYINFIKYQQLHETIVHTIGLEL